MSVTVDLHTHILPAVDDGAEDVSEAIQMLQIAAANGTTDIVLTPHYLARGMRSTQMSKADLERMFGLFKEVAAQNFPKLNLYMGAEVFGVNNIEEVIADGQLITLNNTEYCLVEFGFHDHLQRALGVLDARARDGYKPIVAHPERYEFIQDQPRDVFRMLDKGALLQVNHTSLEGLSGIEAQDVAMLLIENNLAMCISSDAHSTFQRTPDLSEAYEFISSTFSPEYAEDLFFNNPKAILKGKRV